MTTVAPAQAPAELTRAERRRLSEATRAERRFGWLLCSPAVIVMAAVKGGLPPTLMSLYSDPSFIKAYPFAAAIKAALLSASVRPKTPYYQNVSIVISHAVSPAGGINPTATLGQISGGINNALADKGLVP